MRKYGKWVLTLGLLAATPGLTLAAGSKSSTDDKPAADEKKAPKTENQRVAEEIAGAMRSKRIQGDVSIEFKNGVAILSGSVADAKMKDKASEAVRKVRGVTRVDNRMTVADKNLAATAQKQAAPAARQPAEPPARKPVEVAGRRPAQPAAPTSARPDERVVAANHTVSAAASPHVQQVNAEIPAANGSANQEIAEQIGAALTAANLDGYDIEIRYQNGVALLGGSVGTQAEKATATQVVSAIPGVRSVANRLTCSQEPAMAMAAPPGHRPAPGQMPPQMQGQFPGQYPGQFPGQDPRQMPPQMQNQAAMYAAGYRQGDAPAPGMVPGGAPQPGMGAMPMAPGAPMPPTYGHPGMGASQAVFNQPSVPDYAWPAYAQYPNSAAVTYPQQYSASAWPYIGPFYPYPQVPLGWRDATLRWDDGQWNLMFRTRTDKWWWYFNPNNW